jgi:hypothetical protein
MYVYGSNGFLALRLGVVESARLGRAIFEFVGPLVE